jgi:hypothetical protein
MSREVKEGGNGVVEWWSEHAGVVVTSWLMKNLVEMTEKQQKPAAWPNRGWDRMNVDSTNRRRMDAERL